MQYFKIIDPFVASAAGAVIVLISGTLVPDYWHPALAMLGGMLLGMVSQLMLMVILMPFLGAFEVMIPLGIIGMLGGMAGGMAASHDNIPWHCLAATGGVIGLVVATLIRFSNKRHGVIT